jgi:mono/diheme cytochrome c family protein
MNRRLTHAIMPSRLRSLLLLCAAPLCGVALAAQSPSTPAQASARPEYDVDYIGAPLADASMQAAKETYVTFGCAYCHGLTLTPRGEAADLMHSALVGSDTNGDTIVALLRAGIPRTTKLSPMPQFSDLSDRQLHDIARYIHYARQQGHYKEIVQTTSAPGNAAAGGSYFAQNCGSCHSTDLNGIGKKYDAAAMRDRLLQPAPLTSPQVFTLDALNDARMAAGRQRHRFILENISSPDVANLIAYLQTR